MSMPDVAYSTYLTGTRQLWTYTTGSDTRSVAVWMLLSGNLQQIARHERGYIVVQNE
jgi:hypothetical protein